MKKLTKLQEKMEDYFVTESWNFIRIDTKDSYEILMPELKKAVEKIIEKVIKPILDEKDRQIIRLNNETSGSNKCDGCTWTGDCKTVCE